MPSLLFIFYRALVEIGQAAAISRVRINGDGRHTRRPTSSEYPPIADLLCGVPGVAASAPVYAGLFS
jgi:hypothetical protein